MAAPRLMGVFAHPDDEVFCMGGSTALYSARGAEALVVCATRGEAGQIRDGTLATRRTLAAVREAELRRACAILGSTPLLLDHVDGTLADVGVEALAAEIVPLLAEHRPTAVVTFGDDGAYGHPDHVTISRATVAAIRSWGGETRLYTSFFPRQPLLLRERLARWLAGLERAFRGSDDFLRGMALFAAESTTMQFASDDVDVRWFSPGFTIVEQGEAATSLYLILSGEVDVLRVDPDDQREHLATLGSGEFFGELGVAHSAPRSADVVARTGVTCLVLGEPATLYEGRGDSARLVPRRDLSEDAGSAAVAGPEATSAVEATTVVDVTEQVDRKVAAIASHRSQYPISADMFPPGLLRDMFGREHFIRLPRPPNLEQSLLP